MWSGVHAPAMTMSGGLGSDSTTAVYSEDVVTYVDPDAAHQWDRDGYGGAIGLVSQVAGASDDEESDDSEWEDEEHEVRTFECWLSEPTPSHKGVGVWYTLMYRVYEGSLKNTAPSEIRPAPNPAPTPQPLPDDHAKVHWMGSAARVETERNGELRVLDRAFLHGGVARV